MFFWGDARLRVKPFLVVEGVPQSDSIAKYAAVIHPVYLKRVVAGASVPESPRTWI